MYPFLSATQLKRDLLALGESFANRANIFPAWLDQQPSELLARKRFIVCGSVCRAEIRLFARRAQLVAIVDDYLCKTQKTLYGVPVITSDAWVAMCRKDREIVSCLLLSTARAFHHFTKLAAQWNLQTLLPLQFLHLLEVCGIYRQGEIGRFFIYGYEFFLSTLSNLEKLIALSDSLEDDYSRMSWLCILMYRMTLNPFYLEACAVGMANDDFNFNSYSTNRQFFDFSDDEVYVDGGAFTGDTIELFLKATDGRFKHIHAFEPSLQNNGKIRDRLGRLQYDYIEPFAGRFTLHEKGLWDSDATLRFNPSLAVNSFSDGEPATPLAAHLVESGLLNHIYDEVVEDEVSVSVPVTSIDNSTDCAATFIKLEIEGSELKALHGARKTIERNRPKMAISIYHKPEDLATLTSFVLETKQNYKLGFRQHNFLAPDAMVLYCS